MKKKKLKYILGEVRAILLFAFIPTMNITFCSAPIWWKGPYEAGMIVAGISFLVFALLGTLASIHDDYKITIWIDRRKPW